MAQYDPRDEATLFSDESFTEDDVKEIRRGIVEMGLTDDNGNDSAVTWFDFDGDGICDFTAGKTPGGVKRLDRYFLFKGLPNGNFKLMDAAYYYLSDPLISNYIAFHVDGEKLPIILSEFGRKIFQWQPETKKMATCEMAPRQDVKTGSVPVPTFTNYQINAKQSPSALQALCSHISEMTEWANAKLPYENLGLISGEERLGKGESH